MFNNSKFGEVGFNTKAPKDLFVNVSETVTVSEYLSIGVDRYIPVAIENIVLNELLQIYLDALASNVYDSISVTESASQSLTALNLFVSDSIFIYEFAYCYDTELFVGPSADIITVTEDLQSNLDALNIFEFDSASITEVFDQYLDSLYLPVSIESIALAERIFIDLTVLNISVYDDLSISENSSLFFDILYVDVYDSASVTEFSSQYLDALNPSVYDSIMVSEYDLVRPTRGALPGNTQVCSGHDGTRNWRCWFDKVNNRIVFEYATDPDGVWTENVSARISKAGMANDFNFFSNPTEAVATYSAGGILYVRKSTGYPATNFSWDTEYVILIDSSKTYKNARLKKNSDNYYMGVATEVSGSYEYIVAFKSTNTNDVSAWDAEVILGTTSDTNKNFGAITSTYNGQMAMYTDSGNLYYKLYDGANWDVSGTLLCAAKSGYNGDDWDQFDAFYNPTTQETHIIYINADGEVIERDYNSGGLGSENVLEIGSTLYDPNVGFFYGAAYVCYTWANTVDGITSQIDCILENGGMGEIFKLVQISNIAVASDYIKTLTEAGAFITWEEPDGSVHSKSAGLGFVRHEDISIFENINLYLDALYINVDDLISIAELVDISLDALNISIYDDVTISENIEYITDVQNASVYDDAIITEDLVPQLISYIDASDSISITEDYASYLDELFLDVFDSATISENTETFLDVLYVSEFESISVSEDLQLYLDFLNVDLFDDVNILESLDLSLPILNADVYDDLSVSEFASIFDIVVELGPVEDDIAISEFLDLYLDFLYVEIQDDISVSEFFDYVSETIYIDSGDGISASESFELFLDTLFVDVSESITVQESFTVWDIIIELGIVWEDIVLAEEFDIMFNWLVSVLDDVLIDEATSESFYIWKALMTLQLNSEISETFQNREEVWQP